MLIKLSLMKISMTVGKQHVHEFLLSIFGKTSSDFVDSDFDEFFHSNGSTMKILSFAIAQRLKTY